MKYRWLLLLLALVLLNWAGSGLHYRADLTAEKRFSLSAPTERLLEGLDSPVTVEVLLKGNSLPAVFRNLRNNAQELLREMKDVAGPRLEYTFSKPGDGLPDSVQQTVFDSLKSLGLEPYNLTVHDKPGEDQSEQLVFPAALVHYGSKVYPIDFLAGIPGGGANAEASINTAESLLEYKFADAIDRLTRKTAPRVCYLTGNGEPFDLRNFDIIATLGKSYIIDTENLQEIPLLPDTFQAVIVTKPTDRFSELDKLKIDQYVMHGGNVIWFIDNLYAEMDSLRETNQFIAFDRGLNLQDLLFNYGARINEDLVLDINCDQVPLVIGASGGKPEIRLANWPYFPLLEPSDNSPITKNLEPVLGNFVNSIDTVKAPGITKTFLLETSAYGKRLSTPAIVSWDNAKQAPDPAAYNDRFVPTAVLLEGRFHSFFEHYLPSALKDSLTREGQAFIPDAKVPGKMIVVADGDLVLNPVSQSHGPLPMGTNPYTNQQYANREFFQNCMEYLTNPDGVIETRNKQLVLRNLDTEKVSASRTEWQLINVVVPVLLVVLAGLIFQQVRKTKYQK